MKKDCYVVLEVNWVKLENTNIQYILTFGSNGGSGNGGYVWGKKESYNNNARCTYEPNYKTEASCLDNNN